MDRDKTGKLEAKYLKDNYNIMPLLIPKKFNSKNFAELVQRTANDDIIN